jgi:DNA-binding CsgD family transcriptional regulator
VSLYSSTHCTLQGLRCANARSDKDRRAHECLRRVLVGEAPKELAIASDRSVSTIAAATAHSLAQMGFNCRLLYVPYLLVRAAHIRSGFDIPPLRLASGDVAQSWHVSIERPELCLRGFLPASEFEIAGLILEGCSNSEIALRRRVSARTVANQIASLSARLRTSGRLHLLAVFARGEQLDRVAQQSRFSAWSISGSKAERLAVV